MLSDNQECRYGTKKYCYTNWQRARLWFSRIIDAINTPPDREYIEYVLLRPGEPGYDNAPFSAVITPHPLRYRFESGEWIQVDPNEEPQPLNPDWHDATP